MRYLFVFLAITALAYGDKVETMKKNLQNIGKELEKKGDRVQKIVGESHSLKNQVEKIEREIAEIEAERQKILQEIRIVSRTIDYGEKNLSVSKNELERKESAYKAKLLAWNRHPQSLDDTQKSVSRRGFINLLYGDQKKIGYIKEVHEDIKAVKTTTEKEKAVLSGLQAKLRNNLKSIEQKKEEHKRLMVKLAAEKRTHEKAIARLKQEKIRIEREVAKIIAARSKSNKNIKMNTAVKNLGKLTKPVSGNIVVRFGQRKEEGLQSNGIEILSRMGAEVKAASNGKVIYADNFNGLGKVIMIDYGSNMIGVYGNLIALNVKLNQNIKRGSNIGILGHSVEGTPNLYYELRFNLKPIDPVKMF